MTALQVFKGGCRTTPQSSLLQAEHPPFLQTSFTWLGPAQLPSSRDVIADQYSSTGHSIPGEGWPKQNNGSIVFLDLDTIHLIQPSFGVVWCDLAVVASHHGLMLRSSKDSRSFSYILLPSQLSPILYLCTWFCLPICQDVLFPCILVSFRDLWASGLPSFSV